VVVTVRVEVIVPFAAGVTDAGANKQATVALTGAILQVRPTAELNPIREVTEMVEVELLPATVVAETGEAAIVKSLTDKR
jgi:hypothetical protein